MVIGGIGLFQEILREWQRDQVRAMKSTDVVVTASCAIVQQCKEHLCRLMQTTFINGGCTSFILPFDNEQRKSRSEFLRNRMPRMF